MIIGQGATSIVKRIGLFVYKIYTDNTTRDNELNMNILLKKYDNNTLLVLACGVSGNSLVFNYYGNSLQQMIKLDRVTKLYLCEQLFVNISDALSLLHSIGVCHRDVTMNNILYDGVKFRLCDFGRAQICESYTDRVTVKEYSDPAEIKTYNSDYYSFIKCLQYFTGLNKLPLSAFINTDNYTRYRNMFMDININ